MRGLLNERSRRRWAAAEARSHGRGGIAAVARATGISEGTVRRGLAELDAGGELEAERVRRAGAGRPGILEREPGLSEALDALIDPVTRGDPESPLRWTSKSAAKLAAALTEMGHQVVDRTVLRLLKAKGYSLQANKKTREGAQHPDRDAQFAHINQTVSEALTAGEPVISVDAKKRELVGDFKAVGREFQPKGKPVEVRGHDFKDKQLGHAIPYGVYDLAADEGWVSVGITSDTATFAVNTIINWWKHLGKARYPDTTTLTVTADSGASNNPRTRLWRYELQRLADSTGCKSESATPARHVEVEQDRAPHVQLREPQRARKAARDPRGDHQSDRRHPDEHRAQALRPTRRPHLRARNRHHRRPTRRGQHHQTRLTRRLE